MTKSTATRSIVASTPQPVACPECGPHLEWVSHGEHAEQEAALQAAIAQLKMGNIVAIKGIGGFHLACDARNSNAVATLRARKHRPAKPLAVMLPVADGLPDAARQLLTTPAAPIVLVDKKYVPELCDDIAPDLNEVGVMFACEPAPAFAVTGTAMPAGDDLRQPER